MYLSNKNQTSFIKSLKNQIIS